MWGPQSAMVEAQATNTDQGIVPRIFQTLFSEIQRVGSAYLFGKPKCYEESLTEIDCHPLLNIM